MKTTSIVLALSMALAGSAAPQNSRNEVRQFNPFGNNGGFGRGGQQGNANGGQQGNANGGQRGNANGGQQGNANGGQQGNANGGQQGNANGGQQGKTQGNTKGNTGNQGQNGNANQNGNNNNQNTGGAAAGNNNTNAGDNDNQDPQQSLTLDPKVIAEGFANDGQDVPADGQVASLTSTNNFINFCLTVPNLPITNGKQIADGSCNPAPMGILPSTDNMPSSKFVSPKNGDVIKENDAFTITMAIRNMQTGFFVNAQENYFAAPQFLNGQGQIQGHSHVVVELLDSVTQTAPTDPKKFAFFKGLNAAAQNGQLTADVTAGLPAGSYKLSSINSAANHQPVLVPIAQHGSLDDAVYFTVTADGQPDADSDVLTGNNGNNANGDAAAADGAAGKNTGAAGNAGAANTGAANTGAANTGKNAGAANTGAANTGKNAGAANTGAANTGKNTGAANTGAANTGKNTGAANTGAANTGKNTGAANTGAANTGNNTNGGRGGNQNANAGNNANGGRGGVNRNNRRFTRSRL